MIFLFFAILSISANAQYRFDNWTTDNGLPQNAVHAITQTPDGYLWFTTSDGLVRFDGVRFTVFDQSNAKGLTSNRFTGLYVVPEGTLWAGTEDGGLARYHDGVFTAFTVADGLPDNQVGFVQSDGADGLLFTTSKVWAQYHNGAFGPYAEPGYMSDLAVYYGPSGTRWSLDQTGLRQLRDGHETKYPIVYGQRRLSQPLYEDRGGALWLFTFPAGIARVKDGTVTRYGASDGVPAGNYVINAIIEDRHGNVWFGSDWDGLIRFRDGHFTTYTTADGLSSGAIISLFVDREDTLWIGTTEHGLTRVSRQFITTLSTKNGLPGNNVYPILEDRAGTVWLGTDRGLTRYAGGAITNYLPPANPVIRGNVQTMAEDQSGGLWVSDYVNTAHFKDGKPTIPPEIAGKIPISQAIYQDHQGNTWFGTQWGLFKVSNGVVTSYTTKDGLPGDDVKVIYEDHSGGLWFGTYGGLAHLKSIPSAVDGSSPTFISYTTKEGLGSNRVRAVYEDADGTFWIGTYDGGLSRLKLGRFTTYTMAQGLFNNGVFQILEDQFGNFWMSSNRGIYRVGKQQLNDFADGKIPAITSIAYGKLDGMLNTECNGGRQPAGIKTREGKLWFPTLGGVVIIDPMALPFNDQPPPVVIEGVSLDGAAASFRDGVRVAPGQHNIEISYAGLSYTKPDEVRFKYRLVGQDNNWIEVGTRRTAYFSYLPPGDYSFTVIAANSDGVWNTTGASLRMTVVPPFYRTWWFITLAVLAVAGLGMLGYKYRVGRLQQSQAVQEAFSRQLIESQEGERKRIAAELHDSLGQDLLIIKNWALLGLNMSPLDNPAREPLDEISAKVSQAVDEVREISHNLRPHQLERLGLAKTLQYMIQQLDIASGIGFTTEIDDLDGFFSKESEIGLYRIVQESANNIVKHSEATAATVVVKRSTSDVQITIQDNGKGFVPGAVDGSTKGGFGLIGLAERVRMLDGTYGIQSTPGSGTTISITVKGSSEYKL